MIPWAANATGLTHLTKRFTSSADQAAQTPEQSSLEACLEAVCPKGCRAVRRDIATLEAGAQLPEAALLTQEERRVLLHELKQIMAVYGDSCRVEPS